VYFYSDINNNGVFDANDFPIGADYTVVGGVGTIHFLDTNWAPGTYRFFARTLDANYQFSSAATTTITINGTGMSSFALSAGSVVQGANVSLVAQGLPTGSSGYREAYFYYDSNNDGVFQSTDAPIGAAANVNGTATLTMKTDTMAPGTYRYFARALGANYQFSPQTMTQTLTVTAANTQNSTSPGVTAIGAGATLAGKLDASAKEGWYSFQAVAGAKYTIRTELVTLRDSMLSLYDRDGKTLLASNDDGDSGLASRIDWTAPKSGTYFFKVSAFDKTLTGNFRVSLTATMAQSLAAGSADGQSASASTGAAAPLAPVAAVPRMTGASFAPNFDSRTWFTADAANLDGSTIISGRWEYDELAAATSILAASMFEGTLPPSRTDTAVSKSTQLDSDRKRSLLDQHPELRSALSEMLFDDELGLGKSAKSLDRDLNAVDALFAQLAEEDSAGE
jgi:hypothetical protein